MAEPINDGGPAFPLPQARPIYGMSLRAYAAIKLRVPNSGIDWLDEMITAASRDWFAGQALAGLLANPANVELPHGSPMAAIWSIADAMLKERAAK